MRRISQQSRDYIIANFHNTPTEELKKVAGCSETFIYTLVHEYGLKKDPEYLQKIQKQTNSGCFQKGQSPPNKGRKHADYLSPESIDKIRRTQFPKGHKPFNYRPVGSERVNADGYVEVKIQDPRKWVLKHRVVWSQHRGEIPPGYIITFIDGNKQNIVIENLKMISQKSNMLNNSVCNYPEDIQEVIRLKGNLKRRINKLKNKDNEKQDNNTRP